jgi:hypothetical protein
MDQLSIRHAFEDKARELGGKVLGAGFMTVPPFEMDFSFMLEGKKYSVSLVDMEEKRLAKADGIKEETNVAERA